MKNKLFNAMFLGALKRHASELHVLRKALRSYPKHP
jgi:hypothetical protein